MMTNIKGSTKLTGLIGSPVTHSVSPQMHNTAYESLDIDYCYLPITAKSEELESVLDGIRALHFAGVNVTIPHKESVVIHLDEVTRLAKTIGAVNTIVNQDGRLIGYNTDGPGFIDSLKEDHGFLVEGKNVVVLGAGGAAKAIVLMLAQDKVKTLVVSDVDYEKAKTLCEYTNSNFGIAPYAAPSGSIELKKSIEKCDLLVNCTPIGMHPNIKSMPIDESWTIAPGTVVFDLVYNPLETQLLKWAKKKGGKPVSGIDMLVRQGALAFNLFTENPAPIKIMKEAALLALKSFE